MRTSGVLTHTAAGALLASVLLSGCGGDADPKPDPLADPSSSGSPTDDDWAAAYRAYYELGAAFNASNQGATDYQAAVRKVHDASPAAVLTDPSIPTALADQQELAATRDEQIAALADRPVMSDPDLKEATTRS
jgi:hypothetical protein